MPELVNKQGEHHVSQSTFTRNYSRYTGRLLFHLTVANGVLLLNFFDWQLQAVHLIAPHTLCGCCGVYATNTSQSNEVVFWYVIAGKDIAHLVCQPKLCKSMKIKLSLCKKFKVYPDKSIHNQYLNISCNLYHNARVGVSVSRFSYRACSHALVTYLADVINGIKSLTSACYAIPI